MSLGSDEEVTLDFTVKIQIWEGRNIKASDIKPYIRVSFCDSKKSTPVKRSADNPFWNEVFLFNVKKSQSYLLSQTIKFELFGNKNVFTRDVLLGTFLLNVSDVYKKSRHAIQKKWLFLTNDYHEFVGYLKVTVAIVGPNESFPPEELVDDFDNEIGKNVLQPKTVSLIPIALFVKLYEVCLVPEITDSITKNFTDCNIRTFRPALEVSFNGSTAVFSSLKKWANQQVNEGAVILVSNFPTVSRKIFITLVDSKKKKKKSNQDYVARATIDVNSFKKDRKSINLSSPLETSFGPHFVNLFTFTKGETGSSREPFLYMGRIAVEMVLVASADIRDEKSRAPFNIAPLKTPIAYGAEYRLVLFVEELNLINRFVSEQHLRLDVNWANARHSSLPLRLKMSANNQSKSYKFADLSNGLPVIIIDTALEDELHSAIASNVLRRFSEPAVISFQSLKANLSQTTTVANEMEFIRSFAFPEFVKIINSLVLKINLIRRELLDKSFPDCGYILAKMDSIIYLASQFLRVLPRPTFQDVLADIDEMLSHLRDLTVPVLSTLPPVVISFSCKGTKGATFAFVTVPAQDLMYDPYCPGIQFNKSVSTKMRFGRMVTRRDTRMQVAAQLTYRGWIYEKRDGCPTNKSIKASDLMSFCVLNEYQEKALLNWAAGDPRYHDIEGTIFGAIRDIDRVKNEKSKFKFQEKDSWDQLTTTLKPLQSSKKPRETVEHESHTSVCRAFIYAYEFKKSDTLLWTPNKPPFAGSDLVLQKDPDSNEFHPPEGWEWKGVWMVDTTGLSDGIGCDPEGWQYSRYLGDIEDVEINDWVAVPDDRHRLRRRRLVRTLERDQEPDVSDSPGNSDDVFYEYSNNYWDEYFPFSVGDELFRRSLWVRKLRNSYTKGSVRKLPNKIVLLDDRKGGDIVTNVYHALKVTQQSHPWILFSYIYQCQELSSTSKNCNASVRVYVQSQMQSSHVVKKSVNPNFDEMLVFKGINCFESKSSGISVPSVLVEVQSSTSAFQNETFIGRCTVTPTVIQKPSDRRGHLSWVPLTNNGKQTGKILCSFEIVNPQLPLSRLVPTLDKSLDFFSVPYPIAPVTQSTTVEILFWGLRQTGNLGSTMSAVKKAVGASGDSLILQCDILRTRQFSNTLKHLDSHPNFPRNIQQFDMFLPVKREYSPVIDIYLKKYSRGALIEEMDPMAVTTVAGLTHLMTHNPALSYHLAQLSSAGDTEKEVEEKTYEAWRSSERSTEVEFRGGADEEKLGITKVQPSKNKIKVYGKSSKSTQIKDELDVGDFWSLFYHCRKHGVMTTEMMKDEKIPEIETPMLFYQSNLEDFFNNFTDFLRSYPMFSPSKSQIVDKSSKHLLCELKTAIAVYPKLNLNQNFSYFYGAPETAPKKVLVRLYILQADNLPSMDFNTGKSDPYVLVKTSGGQVFGSRDNFVPNCLDPVFGVSFEFKAVLPSDYLLRLEVWDRDVITDDFIGYTEIDIENRWTSKYRATCPLPVKYDARTWKDNQLPSEIMTHWCKRNLYCEPYWINNYVVQIGEQVYELADFKSESSSSETNEHLKELLSLRLLHSWNLVKEHAERRKLFNSNMQNRDLGNLYLWVELYDTELGPPKTPMIDISPREAEPMVLRVVIYSAQETVLEERSFSGDMIADVYVQSWMEGMESLRQKTDVHYRCMDGVALFNWRFVFDFNLIPQEMKVEIKRKAGLLSRHETTQFVPPVLHFQVWDNDFIGSDEFIGEISLNLDKMPRPAQFVHECDFSLLKEGDKKSRAWMSLFQTKRIRGFFPMTRYSPLGDYKELTSKLEVELEVLTEEEAAEKPSGKARDDPNSHPRLEAPERPKTSFHFWMNPWRSCKYVLWRNIKWKVVVGALMILLFLFFFLFLYTFPTVLPTAIVQTTM